MTSLKDNMLANGFVMMTEEELYSVNGGRTIRDSPSERPEVLHKDYDRKQRVSNMKSKIFFSIIFSIMLFCGCKCRNEIIIPFTIGKTENEDNFIKIRAELKHGYVLHDVLTVIVDTGSSVNCISKSGIKKLFYSEESFWDYICIPKNILDETEATAYLDFDTKINSILFYDKEFAFTPDFDTSLFDGILGYTFFSDYDRVTLDFKKNKLVLDGKKIKKNILPLKYEKDKSHASDKPHWESGLFIPVEINGCIYDVYIDTGFDTRGELLLCVPNNLNFEDRFNISVGQKTYKNVLAIKYKDCYFPYDEKNSVKADDRIILGNAFFQNHRIQLDFERMEFSMD